MPPQFHLCLLAFFLAQAFAEQSNVTVYAAMGGQAEFILHLMPSGWTKTGGVCYEYIWRKDVNKKLANFRGPNWTCADAYIHRCKGYENGSLQLSNISREDIGYYSMDLFHANGSSLSKLWFLLQIQEPVSKPMVNFSCHADGTAELSCSVENATNPAYSWTIEGQSVWDSFNYSQQNTRITSINPHPVLRHVICTVKNNISENSSHPINVTCQDPVSEPVVTYSCQEDGTIHISCSVENGTHPKYSWTIEGQSPVDNFSYLQEDYRTISMKSQAIQRDVICTVKNLISVKSSNSTNVLCPVQKCWNQCIVVSVIWGSVALLVTGLALILGCLCTMPKKQQ